MDAVTRTQFSGKEPGKGDLNFGVHDLIVLYDPCCNNSCITMFACNCREVNGLIFCFKTNPVPTDTQNSPPQAVTASHEQTSSESAAPTAHVMR